MELQGSHVTRVEVRPHASHQVENTKDVQWHICIHLYKNVHVVHGCSVWLDGSICTLPLKCNANSVCSAVFVLCTVVLFILNL